MITLALWLRGLLADHKGLLWARGLIVLMLGLLCVLVVVSTLAGSRTFSVAAATLGGAITFNGELNKWPLSGAVICKFREAPDFRASGAGGETPCDPSIYEVLPAADHLAEWPDGTRIQYAQTKAGDLKILVLSAGMEDLPEGSILFVPTGDWQAQGALAFQGEVTIGGVMSTGTADYLLDGAWEAHQTGLATSLFRDVTEVVKRGDLTLGSTVDFVSSNDEPVISYGHITPATGGDGIEVGLLTERAPLALRVSRYGLQDAAIFRPDWIDTIASSPVIIAFAALISFVAGFIQLLLAIPVPKRK